MPLKPFEEGFHENEAFSESKEDFLFFQGVRVPLKERRELLARKPGEALLSFQKPALLILRKDSADFDPKLFGDLKRSLSKLNKYDEILAFKDINNYMGKIVRTDGEVSFSLNKDIADSVINWLLETAKSIESERIARLEEEARKAQDAALAEMTAEEPTNP